MMKPSLVLLLAALVMAGCEEDTEITAVTQETPQPPAVPLADIDQTRVYDVTIENLTNAQPFSPGVVVTHTPDLQVFTVGEPADTGVALIAEAGQEHVAAANLQGAAGAYNVMRIETPTVPMNFPPDNPKPNRTTVRVTAGPGVGLFSVVTMLTCTNDGFTGVDSAELPLDFTPRVIETIAYDAGVEVNNEESEFIVPGCAAFGPVVLPVDGNGLLPEDDVIRQHPGLQGTADLPEMARWTAPVVRITVQRVEI